MFGIRLYERKAKEMDCNHGNTYVVTDGLDGGPKRAVDGDSKARQGRAEAERLEGLFADALELVHVLP